MFIGNRADHRRCVRRWSFSSNDCWKRVSGLLLCHHKPRRPGEWIYYIKFSPAVLSDVTAMIILFWFPYLFCLCEYVCSSSSQVHPSTTVEDQDELSSLLQIPLVVSDARWILSLCSVWPSCPGAQSPKYRVIALDSGNACHSCNILIFSWIIPDII